MGKNTEPSDFHIHVDSSCLTNSTDLEMPAQRTDSNQTVVIHDTAEDPKEYSPADAEQTEEIHHKNEEPKEHRERLNDKIEAQIQEAARRVVASLERDNFDDHNESTLSTRTDESYEDGAELTFDGTEVTDDGTEMSYDETEGTYDSEGENPSHTGRTVAPESELDVHLEQALSAWEPENTTSEIGSHKPLANDREVMVTDQGHTDNEQGDSSSQHDGDIDDDVFSRNSGNSQRSSMNSLHDLNSSDDAYQKALTSPTVGEEASSSHQSEASMSRVPSMASYTPNESYLRTPSKVLNRPPFRTPSSVRAMQMSSPTPSLFSSPRSTKRHLPTVSRIGTPNSQYSPSKRTPTRFKVKKEQPLVLLHVTVMPLQWPLAHAMTATALPQSLNHVKETWLLLQDKLADTVLERGILLPHPQDSYEVLEERLLDALELPIRPRAQILKCGHYMGPTDIESPSSDDEATGSYFQHDNSTGRKWCDICRKDVKLESTGEVCGKRRFNLKIYASNGLMRAGAWSAAWREMERVDVEIEPWVEVGLRSDLEQLAQSTPMLPNGSLQEDDGFVDEEDTGNIQELSVQHRQPSMEELQAEEDQLRMKLQEDEMAQKMLDEEELQRKNEEERQKRKDMEEERMREIYGHGPSPPMESRQFSRRTTEQTVDPDSLADLLLAAFKVLMKDKKNIAIGILSILVLVLALRPGSTPGPGGERPRDIIKKAGGVSSIITEAPAVIVNAATQSFTSATQKVAEIPSKATEAAKAEVPDAIIASSPSEEPGPTLEDNQSVNVPLVVEPTNEHSVSASTEPEIPDVPLAKDQENILVHETGHEGLDTSENVLLQQPESTATDQKSGVDFVSAPTEALEATLLEAEADDVLSPVEAAKDDEWTGFATST